MQDSQFLEQLKLEPKSTFFEPCNNIDIVKRIIANLIYSYEKLGYPEKVDELRELHSSMES